MPEKPFAEMSGEEINAAVALRLGWKRPVGKVYWKGGERWLAHETGNDIRMAHLSPTLEREWLMEHGEQPDTPLPPWDTDPGRAFADLWPEICDRAALQVAGREIRPSEL